VTVIDLGESGELVPMTLHLDPRVTLGTRERADVPAELSDRIAIGRPLCAPINLTAVDAEARPFFAERHDSAFWLLCLTCSFLASEDAPIDRAWLQVRLRSAPPEKGDEPVAWSMEPQALSDPVKIARSAKLSASLKLSSELVPLEVGPAVERGKTSEYTRDVPYVEAHREGTARPAWIFTRTEIVEIRGVHRMRAVVEVSAGRQARAEVSVGADLALKRFGLIPYKSKLADLPEHQTITFGAAL
jgi:hypothetical protein